jgi:hypothetical protein
MTRDDFKDRFREALYAANAATPDQPDASLDQIELHFHGIHDQNFDTALSNLWISEDLFFLVIDVALHSKRRGWFFVRPSGHEPAALTQTFNNRASAPFHVMAPK